MQARSAATERLHASRARLKRIEAGFKHPPKVVYKLVPKPVAKYLRSRWSNDFWIGCCYFHVVYFNKLLSEFHVSDHITCMDSTFCEQLRIQNTLKQLPFHPSL